MNNFSFKKPFLDMGVDIKPIPDGRGLTERPFLYVNNTG